MSQHHRHERSLNESLITALAWGGFLIVVGVVFGLTPGIGDAIGDFFFDLTGVTYPGVYGTIMLPAPANPAAHQTVYQAVFNFMLAIGVLQIVILAARLLIRSPVKRTAETTGNLIWWVGGAAAAYVYLMAGTVSGWFTFWPMLIILAGISLIVQGVIRIAYQRL
jgi:lysylphosphatidylglycerol synthetase-like protein (DUF2156 family)